MKKLKLSVESGQVQSDRQATCGRAHADIRGQVATADRCAKPVQIFDRLNMYNFLHKL